MEKKTALITGGNGIIGRNMVHYLESTDNWNIIVTSHSPLGYKGSFEYLQMDLTQTGSVEANYGKLKNITHVFFAAYVEMQTLAQQTTVNAQLLQNLVSEIERVSPVLKHVTLIQGGKAYGAHLGKYKTPAKETDHRHFPPNFYYSQEDFLRRQSVGKNWSWTALRPDIVIGLAIGNPMNLATIIAVYATFCKELGVPMRFPGPDKAYDVLVNVTDALLLSKGIEYVATHHEAKGEVFNFTNGDIFRWQELWEKFGAYFGVEVDVPMTFSLSAYMADKKHLWDEINQKYKLQGISLNRLVQWPFGEFIFNNIYDAILDVNKLRRIGFHEMQLDSYSSFERVFNELKSHKIIPA
ncbi:MAG: NAD-dependent epimerase/dehydratase [Mucilaginibacter sp.]|nr:NAD-dependent epimerase/dehydratase [Mucilaginibacter sp.]